MHKCEQAIASYPILRIISGSNAPQTQLKTLLNQADFWE